jgi:hypothetical protein
MKINFKLIKCVKIKLKKNNQKKLMRKKKKHFANLQQILSQAIVIHE